MNSVAAFLLFSLIPLAVHGRILYAQAVFRHGDRAPSRNYPNDPYDKSFWPMGWSQLTEKGANETQELGRFLRQKYLQGQVVDNEDQVYVRSSSKTRAIKSAENVLIGLFPDESQRSHVVIEQDTKHWEDQLLKPNSVACPRYDEVRKIENRKNMERLNKKHEAFFAFVSRNAGVNVTMEPRGEGTLGVSDIFNAVYRETQNGFEQPAWVTSEFEPNLTAYDLILELKRVDRLMQFNSPQKSKLRAGFLLGDFVKRLEYAAKRQNKHKLVLYSSVGGLF
ncbi:hypothetical protein L596_024929 [Steinernema carpocapsae]|uniref:Uncharacterized protein n=1 Tax=Steinernema carpocapsae TaxID=34508 RepID=A0A4U5M744_STECR|nr:hypothetical protein L596_024929 [Steinernema carpocapsae]